MTERAAREGLRQLVGEIDEDGWAYLVKKCVVEAVTSGDEDLNWLAQEYRELLAIRGGTISPSKPAPKMLEPTGLRSGRTPERRFGTQLRLETLSRLVAREVAQDSGVVTFRQQILQGQLIDPHQVEEWVRQRSAADGQATFVLAAVPVPRTSKVTWTGEGYAIEPAIPVALAHEGTNLYLSYGLPGDQSLRLWTVTLGGTLDRLRVLSNRLANWYGWESGQSTLFVLTGWVPSLQEAEASLRYRRLPSLTRLELKVDPTLTPQEVAEIYRRARANTMGRRYRRLSKKHYTLATFADDAEDKSIEQQMRAWNEAYPEWGYTQPSNFSRDRAQARRRVLCPPLANDPFAKRLQDGPTEVEVVEP